MMLVQEFVPLGELCHTQVTAGELLTPSSSFRVAVSVVPADGGSAENLMVPGSSTSVMVMVTAWVSSESVLAVPLGALLSVTWMVTV